MFPLIIASLISLVSPAPTSRTLPWVTCPSPLPSQLQCAQLKVPLDWAHPGGKKTTLGLTKVPAKAPTKKGVLFFNPGGPGLATSDLLAGQALGYDIFAGSALPENFDIVGIDPRGVGLSEPITCDPAAFNMPWPKFPQSETAYNDLVNYNNAYWESCLNQTGPFLGHVDTLSVAKDFEAVRIAMGKPEMNFLGTSYGTQIGSQYANLYANNFRTMALDSNVDHSQTLFDAWQIEALAYETELKRFIAWCEADSTCVLYGQNVTHVWIDLVDSAFKNSIPAPGCNGPAPSCQPSVWGGDILFNAQDMLFFKESALWANNVTWSTLAIALKEAAAGNATLLSSPAAMSNTDANFAEPAVQCADWPTPVKSFIDLRNIYSIASYLAPLTQGAIANPPAAMNITNSRNNTILMTNGLYDPSTSIVWAESLREQIAQANLVIRDGDGHTSFDLGGQTTAIIEDYLVNDTPWIPYRDYILTRPIGITEIWDSKSLAIRDLFKSTEMAFNHSELIILYQQATPHLSMKSGSNVYHLIVMRDTKQSMMSRSMWL